MLDIIVAPSTVTTTYDALVEEGTRFMSVTGVGCHFEVWMTGDQQQVVAFQRPTSGARKVINVWMGAEHEFDAWPIEAADDVMRATLELAIEQNENETR